MLFLLQNQPNASVMCVVCVFGRGLRCGASGSPRAAEHGLGCRGGQFHAEFPGSPQSAGAKARKAWKGSGLQFTTYDPCKTDPRVDMPGKNERLRCDHVNGGRPIVAHA